MATQPPDPAASDPRRDESFLRLFLENERRVYTYIHALVPNWADADDIRQETAAVLWRKFAEFDAATDFLAWALTVARFQILAHRKRCRLAVALGDEVMTAVAADMEAFLRASTPREDALQWCLEKLSAPDRQLVLMRYQPGASTETVAAQVGRSTKAVYKALNRIHERLLLCVRESLAAGGQPA